MVVVDDVREEDTGFSVFAGKGESGRVGGMLVDGTVETGDDAFGVSVNVKGEGGGQGRSYGNT